MAYLLGTQEDGLHQRDEVLRSSEPEDIQTPEVGHQQQEVREDEASEQVLMAGDHHRPMHLHSSFTVGRLRESEGRRVRGGE